MICSILQGTGSTLWMGTTRAALGWSWTMRPTSSTSPRWTTRDPAMAASPSPTPAPSGPGCTGPQRPTGCPPCSPRTGTGCSAALWTTTGSFRGSGTWCTRATCRRRARTPARRPCCVSCAAASMTSCSSATCSKASGATWHWQRGIPSVDTRHQSWTGSVRVWLAGSAWSHGLFSCQCESFMYGWVLNKIHKFLL